MIVRACVRACVNEWASCVRGRLVCVRVRMRAWPTFVLSRVRACVIERLHTCARARARVLGTSTSVG